MKKNRESIYLGRFGAMIGLSFLRGGAAEVSMRGLEVRRIVECWIKYEQSKKHPDSELLEALQVVLRKGRNFDERIVATVPIAARRARLVPVLDGSIRD